MSISQEINSVLNILDELNIPNVINNIIINYVKVPKETFYSTMYDSMGAIRLDMLHMNDMIIMLIFHELQTYIDIWKSNVLISRKNVTSNGTKKLINIVNDIHWKCDNYIEFKSNSMRSLFSTNTDAHYQIPCNKILVYRNYLLFSVYDDPSHALHVYNMTNHEKILTNIHGLLGCIYKKYVIMFDVVLHNINSYAIKDNMLLEHKSTVRSPSDITDICTHDDLLYILTGTYKTSIIIYIYNFDMKPIRHIKFSNDIKLSYYYSSSIIVTDEFVYVSTRNNVIILQRTYVINNNDIIVINVPKKLT